MDGTEPGPSGLQPGPSGLQSSKRNPILINVSPKKKRVKQNPLKASDKEVVLNIHKLVMEMWPKTESPSRLDVVLKTAETAGVSTATVYRILKEKKSDGDVKSPPPRKRQPYKFEFDDITLSGIRRIVHNFFFRNEMPTLDKVLVKVNEDETLPNMSRSTLHNVLRNKLSFKYCKRNRTSTLIDRNDIITWRYNYIQDIRKYRAAGKKIYYLDETWVNEGHTKSSVWQDPLIKTSKEAHREGLSTGLKNPSGKGKRLIILHIGSTDGFVDGGELIFEAKKGDGDYHSEMDAHNFEKWFSGLRNKLEKDAVIVMDNASYHSRRQDKIPTDRTRKADIQAWLREKNISFEDKEVRGSLLTKVKLHKHLYQKYVIDEMAKEMGYTILRLPPYHCELNPIELIWAQMKGYIATKNTNFKMATIKKLVPEAFAQITADSWKSCIEHVVKEEHKMMKLDWIIEDTVEKIIINTADDSSSLETDDE